LDDALLAAGKNLAQGRLRRVRDSSAAPPAPCTRRQSTSVFKLLENPQSMDATMKNQDGRRQVAFPARTSR